MSIYLLSPLVKEGTISMPMIAFTLLDITLDFKGIDILMFTSKQAVKSAEALNPRWKDVRCLAIGKSTAKMIESLGGKVLHQPKDFYGKSLSEDILKYFKNQSILYLRPEVISFDSKAFLYEQGIFLEEKIIYKTTCISYTKEAKPPNDSIIIFTSPSTIKCFLKNFTWECSYLAIVIGEATKKHLPKNAKYDIADMPTIGSCVRTASLLNTSY